MLPWLLLLPPLQAQLQALAAAQAQAQMQLQMQQALLASVPGVAPVAPGAIVAVPGGAAASSESSAQRKAREIHVGNLAVGSATPEVLTEVFNTALAGFVPDARITPPVKLVNVDATGGNTVGPAAVCCRGKRGMGAVTGSCPRPGPTCLCTP